MFRRLVSACFPSLPARRGRPAPGFYKKNKSGLEFVGLVQLYLEPDFFSDFGGNHDINPRPGQVR